jgi:hypothetical protein
VPVGPAGFLVNWVLTASYGNGSEVSYFQGTHIRATDKVPIMASPAGLANWRGCYG